MPGNAPKLPVEPTVVVPPEIHLPSLQTGSLGDPFFKCHGGPPSSGTGSGGGVGSGSGGGVGWAVGRALVRDREGVLEAEYTVSVAALQPRAASIHRSQNFR